MPRDCLGGGRCYRCCVPTSFRPSRGSCIAAFLALALASAGCASPQDSSVRPQPASPASEPALTPPPAEEAWWRRTGDPILASLVERGLAGDKEAACRLTALRQRDRAAAAKTVGGTLKRLFAKETSARDQAAREIVVRRLADRRARLAGDIALAYLDLRRLQQIHTLRANVLDQYKDNAQIAEFRRQAGLVSAVDGALAASQDEAARAELGYVDGRLQDALAALSRLVGEEPGVLAGQVGVTAPLPFALLSGADAQADNGREAALNAALEAANRTAKDARSAYREGAGNFATLYVAEAAVLSLAQALADARAQRAGITLRQWSARAEGWARADIEKPASASVMPQTSSGNSEAADCD